VKGQTNPSVKAHLLRITFVLLALLAVCVLPFALGQRNSANESTRFQKAGLPSPTRTLSFAERVAYQRAIEEVYWRHRIWPAANAGAEPPVDRVMSQTQIDKKVEDYLRNSQALEDYWQRADPAATPDFSMRRTSTSD